MARQYKMARKMKKIALTAAAKELDVTQPTLSSWESERKNPSVDALIRMAKYYGVTTDFLLGLSSENDPRMNMLRPVPLEALPALHGSPVYNPRYGWAFVDAIERQLRCADGLLLPFADARDLYLLPPAFSVREQHTEKPLGKEELTSLDEVWVEPISADSALCSELCGWYKVRARYVENEVGQRFYFDFYAAKWLAFAQKYEDEG